MVEEFKNLILAGIGTAATSYEKASKTIDEMVKKGKLTMDEGKELSEELKRNIKGAVKEKNEESKPLTKEEMASLLREMNFATKDDIDELKARIEKLEAAKASSVTE
jgi:polyhydroxyalkanoate synthesis regulator phasin